MYEELERERERFQRPKKKQKCTPVEGEEEGSLQGFAFNQERERESSNFAGDLQRETPQGEKFEGFLLLLAYPGFCLKTAEEISAVDHVLFWEISDVSVPGVVVPNGWGWVDRGHLHVFFKKK